MAQYKVFELAGNPYELYISDKDLGDSFILLREYKTMRGAENYVEAQGLWLNIDKDIVNDSQYNWVGDDYDAHIFDVDNMQILSI